MKKIECDYYADGYNLDQIRCFDLSRACACGCYNKEFYYIYCFLYAMHRNFFWKKGDKAEDIYELLGLKEEVIELKSGVHLLDVMKNSINNGNPVLLVLRYDAIYFNSLYHQETDLRHGLLINGFDNEKGLINVKDYLPAKNLVRALAERKAEIFMDLVIKENHLVEMWEESAAVGVNEIRILKKCGAPKISNYNEMLIYYLENASIEPGNYTCYNRLSELEYGDIRKRLYNSSVMLLDVVRHAVRIVNINTENLDEQITLILKNRNAATYIFLKEFMKHRKVNEYMVEYMLENDRRMYELMKIVLDLLREEKKVTYENMALFATVLCDSEAKNAPAKNAVNGTISCDEDCWLSSSHYEEHFFIVDLSVPKEANAIVIKHHPKKRNLVTCNFRVEGSNDLNNWVLINEIKNNEKNQTTITFKTTKYRYFRLYITKANIINENAARIYGFEIYRK